jgi:hypothetical protein
MSHFLLHTPVHRGAFQKQAKKGQKITSAVPEKDSSHQGGTLPTLNTVRRLESMSVMVKTACAVMAAG